LKAADGSEVNAARVRAGTACLSTGPGL